MSRLTGKTALITGGSTGIGLASAIRFAAEGARVYIAGRRQAEIDKAIAKIGHGATGIRCDVSSLEDLDHLYAQIKSEAGQLDILFANAGLGTFAPLGDISEADFDHMFGVNVKGTLFTVSASTARRRRQSETSPEAGPSI